ncbi:hypothetical protein IY145_05065 [Methylosinus sp. H3A]|uniref:hypothetical protein n=1 Tax=Methylosinus sp. H3A TaxID=2785786 RepID=UPI0018C26FAE|nr:hypothetical protein [Methylosinus sp. H3A]MBG0808741.1 hypothetical protein [Methylosinus sp. H3A]
MTIANSATARMIFIGVPGFCASRRALLFPRRLKDRREMRKWQRDDARQGIAHS